MSRDVKNYTLLDAAGPRAIVSSTNASPIEITAGSPHGYETGQKVSIVGHAVNTGANGSWVVTVTGANTFTLDGSVGVGIGGATGIFAPKSKYAYCDDAVTAVFAFDSDGAGDAILTAKLVGSIQKNPPDFALPQGPNNQYEFIQMMDLENSVAVDGDTGIVLATADVNRMLEANVNGVRWLAVLLTDGSIGELTVKARLFN
jgi:hypothetical protein